MVIIFQSDKHYATKHSRVKNRIYIIISKIIKSKEEGPEESPNQNWKIQMSR